jgi:threonine aldolase
VSTLPTPPAAAFASDNAAGAHPAVIDAVIAANDGHALAYGADASTHECEQRFRDLFDADVTTRLAFNGTGANVLALATLLGSLPGPNHAVVCTDWAHIAVDETGAPERALGTKLMALPSPGAKLVPEQLAELAQVQGVQHHAQPGVVSITQATELGTLYSIDEIAALCDQAHALGMLVHLDGARIANAVAALGNTRSTLRAMTIEAGVDAVSFGGTKNGLLGAEAVVFCSPASSVGSEYVRKQVTQLPSKMRFLAAQFNAVLEGDLWLSLASHANTMATELHHATANLPGVLLGDPPAVNSVFPRLPREVIQPLRDWCFFWDWDTSIDQVRWMTAWDTTSDDVATFAKGVEVLTSDTGRK